MTSESGSSSHSSSDSSISVDKQDIDCSECRGKLRNEDRHFFKCSICKHYNLCFTCMRNNKHSNHSNDLQLFRDPLYPKAGFCKSCGYQFFPEGSDTFYVYHCKQCVRYALCFNCKKQQRHSHHDEYLQKILLRDYKVYIT